MFRPADAIEALECWQLALRAKKTASILALTRTCRLSHYEEPIYDRGYDWPLPEKPASHHYGVEPVQLLCRRSKSCVI